MKNILSHSAVPRNKISNYNLVTNREVAYLVGMIRSVRR
jgi:hypothetical protein